MKLMSQNIMAVSHGQVIYHEIEHYPLAAAGSVDDGKSTLIGRLLYDSKAIFEDQLEAVEQASQKRGDEYVDLALLMDGLRAEREQKITIDVAYRYFTTPKMSEISSAAKSLRHRYRPIPRTINAMI